MGAWTGSPPPFSSGRKRAADDDADAAGKGKMMLLLSSASFFARAHLRRPGCDDATFDCFCVDVPSLSRPRKDENEA